MDVEAHWGRGEPAPRRVAVPRRARADDRNAARVLAAIALASIGAGAIHIAAAATEGRDSAQNLAFFAAVGTAELVWGAVALFRAPRWWLALGAAGNLVVLTTWVVSRTVGLPVGEYAGITLPVGFPDALATALGAVVVIGAVALMVQGRGPARSAARSPGVAIAAAVLVGALALGGVLSQAGAFASSGSGGNGGGGQTSSGGGSSGGGGYYGY